MVRKAGGRKRRPILEYFVTRQRHRAIRQDFGPDLCDQHPPSFPQQRLEAPALRIGQPIHEILDVGAPGGVPGLKSIFHWQGQVCTEDEVLMLVKSRADQFPDLARKVKEHHGYEVPEIISLPILAGDDAYLSWLREEMQPSY